MFVSLTFETHREGMITAALHKSYQRNPKILYVVKYVEHEMPVSDCSKHTTQKHHQTLVILYPATTLHIFAFHLLPL